MKTNNNKFKDTADDISAGSRVDRYWQIRGFEQYYKGLRRPQLPYNYMKGTGGVYSDCLAFGIKGIEFGNWVNGEARFNFLVGCIIALNDIRLATGLPKAKIGAGRLGIAFGARGGGAAIAHFEPGNWVINLTRHLRGGTFGESGGIGSLAHEYGHFLDYFFGTYKQPGSERRSLSLGRLTTTDTGEFPGNIATLSGIVNKIIKTCIWQGADYTPYYRKMKEKTSNPYWFRHNEIFARCFEQYVHYKLKEKGIRNVYLTHAKYESWTYPDTQLFNKIVPLYTKLLAMMAKRF